MPFSSQSRVKPVRLTVLVIFAGLLFAVALVRWGWSWRLESTMKTASLAELQSLAARNPENHGLFHALGERATAENRSDIALDAYWRAVQLSPDSEADWIGWAGAARRSKGPQAADRILADFLRNRPRSAKALVERAKLYRVMEYHKAAFQYAEQASAIDPALVDAWGIMAEQSRELRDYATAAHAAERAISLAPSDWRGRLELGRILLAERRTADAIAPLREAVRLAPDRAVTHLHLGEGLLLVAHSHLEFDQARLSLHAAAALTDQLSQRDRFNLLLALGQSFQRESDWKAAVGPLVSAAKLQPGDETIHFALAQVFRGLGDRKQSEQETRIHQDIAAYHAGIRYLLMQIAGAPRDPAPRLKLAELYKSRGNVVEAAETYRNMIARGQAKETAEKRLLELESRVADVRPASAAH